MLFTGMKDVWHLPCAGITLIRFYGFDLSPQAFGERTPRGNAEILAAKLRENFF
jgi:hypothetical protein